MKGWFTDSDHEHEFRSCSMQLLFTQCACTNPEVYSCTTFAFHSRFRAKSTEVYFSGWNWEAPCISHLLIPTWFFIILVYLTPFNHSSRQGDVPIPTHGEANSFLLSQIPCTLPLIAPLTGRTRTIFLREHGFIPSIPYFIDSLSSVFYSRHRDIQTTEIFTVANHSSVVNSMEMYSIICISWSTCIIPKFIRELFSNARWLSIMI